VPRWHPVEDGGAAGDEALQAGDASGGVDEHVGGGDQVAHAVGETEHAHPRVRAVALLEPLTHLLVSPGNADHSGGPHVESAADCPLEIADAPAAAGDQHHVAGLGQREQAAGVGRRAGLEEGGRHQRAHLPRPTGSGELLDPPRRAVVHDQVKVDARMGPELEAREVEDRGADRGTEAAAAAQPPEDRVDPGVGRDHDVRGVGLDQPEQSAAADTVEERVCAAANRAEAHQQGVDDPEQPRHPPELEPRPVADHALEQRSQRGQPVRDRDLDPRALLAQAGRQRPSGRVVAFPEVGGQDEDPPRRVRRGLGVAVWSDRRSWAGAPFRISPGRAPAAWNLPASPDDGRDVAGRALGHHRARGRFAT
jgi:hypothetical protein